MNISPREIVFVCVHNSWCLAVPNCHSSVSFQSFVCNFITDSFHSFDLRSYASLPPRVSTWALCLSSYCLTFFACVCTILIVFVPIFQNGIAWMLFFLIPNAWIGFFFFLLVSLLVIYKNLFPLPLKIYNTYLDAILQ